MKYVMPIIWGTMVVLAGYACILFAKVRSTQQLLTQKTQGILQQDKQLLEHFTAEKQLQLDKTIREYKRYQPFQLLLEQFNQELDQLIDQRVDLSQMELKAKLEKFHKELKSTLYKYSREADRYDLLIWKQCVPFLAALPLQANDVLWKAKRNDCWEERFSWKLSRLRLQLARYLASNSKIIRLYGDWPDFAVFRPSATVSVNEPAKFQLCWGGLFQDEFTINVNDEQLQVEDGVSKYTVQPKAHGYHPLVVKSEFRSEDGSIGELEQTIYYYVE